MNDKIINQNEIYDFYKDSEYNNCVTRQLQKTCIDLYNFENSVKEDDKNFPFKENEFFKCYGCSNKSKKNHKNYVFSCQECGSYFKENRNIKRDLSEYTFLVIGARTKLGHQIVIKLLKSGATVIGTSRFPEKAMDIYSKYPEELVKNLYFYDKSFDLDVTNIKDSVEELKNYISEEFHELNGVIFCAAQTIRVREKRNRDDGEDKNEEKNRYQDSKFVNETYVNSWEMKIEDLLQEEMEEVSRINSIAPCILIQRLLSLLKKSTRTPYIINVNAREGLFAFRKSKQHFHTNMAKASLAMLTKCLCESGLKTENGLKFSIHSCDPGWISVDEYYEKSRPWAVPPLDEIDGAARILYPVFKKLGSCSKTRRHFNILTY